MGVPHATAAATFMKFDIAAFQLGVIQVSSKRALVPKHERSLIVS